MPVMCDTVSACLFHCFVLSLAFVTTQHNAALFTIQWMDSSDELCEPGLAQNIV